MAKKSQESIIEGPVDHGDGRPAVSFPAGSYDSEVLATALDQADPDDEDQITAALSAAQTVVVAEPEVVKPEVQEKTSADPLTGQNTDGSTENNKEI
jgi:hypothetical protein